MECGVDLYVHQQAINNSRYTSRKNGVQHLPALGEYEREFDPRSVSTPVSPEAETEGKKLGRPSNVNDSVVTSVKLLREKGCSISQHRRATSDWRGHDRFKDIGGCLRGTKQPSTPHKGMKAKNQFL